MNYVMFSFRDVQRISPGLQLPTGSWQKSSGRMCCPAHCHGETRGLCQKFSAKAIYFFTVDFKLLILIIIIDFYGVVAPDQTKDD